MPESARAASESRNVHGGRSRRTGNRREGVGRTEGTEGDELGLGSFRTARPGNESRRGAEGGRSPAGIGGPAIPTHSIRMPIRSLEGAGAPAPSLAQVADVRRVVRRGRAEGPNKTPEPTVGADAGALGSGRDDRTETT